MRATGKELLAVGRESLAVRLTAPDLALPSGRVRVVGEGPGRAFESAKIKHSEELMNVRAVYENGILKPREPLPLREHEEVEIDVRRDAEQDRRDPRDFVGFIKGGIKGMPVAAHHDKFIGQDQYGHMKGYLRNAMSAPGWSGLGRDEQLRRFVGECRRARPDFRDLWEDMDRIPHVWSNAFEYCRRAIEREAA